MKGQKDDMRKAGLSLHPNTSKSKARRWISELESLPEGLSKSIQAGTLVSNFDRGSRRLRRRRRRRWGEQRRGAPTPLSNSYRPATRASLPFESQMSRKTSDPKWRRSYRAKENRKQNSRYHYYIFTGQEVDRWSLRVSLSPSLSSSSSPSIYVFNWQCQEPSSVCLIEVFFSFQTWLWYTIAILHSQ